MPSSTTTFTAQVRTYLQFLWICVCREKKADLATPSARSWWVARIYAGQVISAGGGPPCETFTIARSRDEGGPRPLRSAMQPQGLPGLTRREWAQVQIGNKLLRFLIEVLLTLAAAGCSGFLEHPQFPTWLQINSSGSIWTMDTIRCVKQMHCVSIISSDQCTSPWEKADKTLLLVRLPKV